MQGATVSFLSNREATLHPRSEYNFVPVKSNQSTRYRHRPLLRCLRQVPDGRTDSGSLSGCIGGYGADPCDFDGSGSLDVGDINLLSAAIAGGETDAKWDVNKDGAVNVGDLDFLVTDSSKLNTYIGDANLNGEFNSGDLVVVFSAGEYEDGVAGNSTWGTGDWNADLEFGSGDLVAAFTDGGYEQGPKAAAVAVVPEPSSFVLLTIAGLLILRRRRVS